MWGLLAGGLFLTAPVVGPVVVVGSFAAMVITGIEGAAVVGAASALAAALASIGIPKDTVLQYEQAIKADGFVILVQGTAEEKERARSILKTSNAKQVDAHCCSGKSMNENAQPKVKIAS
jgi:DNA-binding LacI/PurR family transcriptional regulator